MMRDACEMWLGPEYGCDGLRFDSANDFPPETVQAMTWALREKFPGRILTAEARPGPALWVLLTCTCATSHAFSGNCVQQHLGR